MDNRHFVVTGGAGYIGSLITAHLLARGNQVTVIDALHFGADGLLAFFNIPGFKLVKGDITQADTLVQAMSKAACVIHLAALVGFPICNQVGRETTWRVNVEGSKNVYKAAQAARVERFIYASSYSNYGLAPEGVMVDEESPLQPQSVYAESKVAAEQFLLEQLSERGPAVTCLRLATVFGVSPRTRFDLMVNQFAWQAHCGETLVIYQQDFQRAFVHVQDVARAMLLVADTPPEKVAGQIFNVGHESLNSSKKELIALIQERWPSLKVETQHVNFGGDMRSIHVSFAKIQRILNYQPQIDLRQGIAELHHALSAGWIYAPGSDRHRNHPPLLT